MGTRGYHVYRWRGRYYVYYNHWDSYPSGLGKTLLSMIPKDPEAYKQWLAQKRAEYSDIERRLECEFTITNPFAVNDTHSASVEGLEMLPSFSKPSNDLFIEWLYVIDLDYELFSVNNHFHFKLSSVPNKFEHLLKEAKRYSSGRMAHPSITSETLSHPEPFFLDVEHYKQLNATLVRPRQTLETTRKPLSYLCRQLFPKLITRYRDLIWRAVDASLEEDFLYREVAFQLLCLATCSPELVRLGRQCKPSGEFQPFAVMSTNGASGQTTEFASELFEGYHLSGKNIGSAPLTKTYWLCNVLISLERSLNCRENYEAAIYRVVQKGRDEGHIEFNAIVCSIQQIVLVRVTKHRVEHTKSLKVFGFDSSDDEQTDDEQADDEQADDEQNDDEQADDEQADDEQANDDSGDESMDDANSGPSEDRATDWADADTAHTFDAIGKLFECAARRNLKPSTAYRHGIFPNELYRMIIDHLDAPTNISCMSVSRAFRDFALDTYHMTDNIKVSVSQEKGRLEIFHNLTGTKSLPRFSTVYDIQDKAKSLWFPIIGKADGTGQFIPSIGIYLPALAKHLEDLTADETIYEVTTRGQRLDPYRVDELFRAEHQNNSRFSTPEGVPAKVFDYSTFEELLPTQDVLASSSDVVGLYALTYFIRLNIFGCTKELIFGTYYRSRPMSYIAKAPLDTWMQIGGRKNSSGIAAPYAMLWAKQPQEDTSNGWNNAVNEAQYRAKHEFVDYMYKLWMSKAATPKEGVLLVLIGSKIKFFRICCDLDIPSLENFPHLTADEGRFINDLHRKQFIHQDTGTTVWDENEIHASELRDQIFFQPLDCENGDSVTSNDNCADVAPLHVLNKKDRSKIEHAFQHVTQLANSLGKPLSEYQPS